MSKAFFSSLCCYYISAILQMAKRRSRTKDAPEVKPLTQEELLAEAAKTELENQRSLQVCTSKAEPLCMPRIFLGARKARHRWNVGGYCR